MNQALNLDLGSAQTLRSPSPLGLWRRRLTLLLMVQLVLILGIYAYQQHNRALVQVQPLLTGSSADLDRLVISDGIGDDHSRVSLEKQDNVWRLPDLESLPADPQKVAALLDKVASVQLSLPVTTSTSSHARFDLADNQFQRKVSLYQGDQLSAEFFLGSSPGLKKVYLRPANQSEVYVVDLTSFDFALSARDWLQKDLLAVKSPDYLKGVDYELLKSANDWQLVGGTKAELDADKVGNLVDALANLQVQEPVAQQPEGETISLSVKAGGTSWDYEFIKNETSYWVKRSDLAQYFAINPFNYESIAAVTKATLIRPEPAAETEASPKDPITEVVEGATQGILN